MNYKEIMNKILNEEKKVEVTYDLLEKYINEINKALDKNSNKRIQLSDYQKFKNDSKALNRFFRIKKENNKYNLYMYAMGPYKEHIDLMVADVTNYFK